MDLKDIAKRIKYFRMKKNIKANDLSFSVGKASNYISVLEKRGANSTTSTLLNIIEILGVTPEEFFYEDYKNYSKDKLLNEEFRNLTPSQKDAVFSVVMNFRNK